MAEIYNYLIVHLFYEQPQPDELGFLTFKILVPIDKIVFRYSFKPLTLEEEIIKRTGTFDWQNWQKPKLLINFNDGSRLELGKFNQKVVERPYQVTRKYKGSGIVCRTVSSTKTNLTFCFANYPLTDNFCSWSLHYFDPNRGKEVERGPYWPAYDLMMP